MERLLPDLIAGLHVAAAKLDAAAVQLQTVVFWDKVFCALVALALLLLVARKP